MVSSILDLPAYFELFKGFEAYSFFLYRLNLSKNYKLSNGQQSCQSDKFFPTIKDNIYVTFGPEKS